jgi:hypothetical protein
VCRLLQDARDRGVRAIDVIARRESPEDADRQTVIARYLQQAIAYDLDGPFLEGLRTFYRLLAAHRLIEGAAALRLFDCEP